MHIRREITEYVGKKYTDGGDIHWALDRDKMKTHTPPLIIQEESTDFGKEVFKVEVPK